MMSYCAHVVSRFSRHLQERTFDQDDVALFILMTRDYCQKGSALRELGDFLAHPKARDRGLVFSALEASAKIFEEFLEADRISPYQLIPKIDFKPLERKSILQDIKTAFKVAGIDVKIEVTEKSFDELISCIILLIQNCAVDINGQRACFDLKYGHGIYLSAIYVSEKFPAQNALFPLLSVGNINKSFLHPAQKIDKYIARRIKDGRLIALPYSVDVEKTGTDLNETDLDRALLLTR